MNPDDLRAYARRDWRGAERSKREHWAREIALRGPLATFEASQVLWEHMRRLRPDWPSPEERRADLAHHIALKHALDLAAGAFRSTANCVPVVSAADLVVMKVLAGRPRDLDDVVAVIHGHGHEFDWHRIRTTLGLLEGALARRDLLSELDRLAAAARAPGEPPRP